VCDALNNSRTRLSTLFVFIFVVNWSLFFVHGEVPNFDICLIGSETKGTVRFQIFGDKSASLNHIVPGGTVTGQKHWKLFDRVGRDHFLCITDGLLDFCANFDTPILRFTIFRGVDPGSWGLDPLKICRRGQSMF